MRSTRPPRAAALLPSLLVPLLLLLTLGVARAQGDLDGNKGKTVPAGSPRPPRPAPPRPGPTAATTAKPTTITREVVRTRTEYVRIATVTVVAEPNAVVTLTRVGRGARPEVKKVPADKSIVTFDTPTPGPYLVKATLDGYRPAEQRFAVAANRAHDVELNLAPITHDVALSINAPSGMVFYSKGGDPPVAAPFQNGAAVLPELQRGRYALEVKPDDASYLPLRTTIDVPTSGGSIALTLERPLSTEEFSWSSLKDWMLPEGWGMRSRRLATKEKGLALPRADGFRYYKDFELAADVRMVNGVAVSFALRVADPQKYYLIQLTGKNADEPYVLRAFVVRDGVEHPLGQTRPISQLAETIRAGKDFRVSMTMKDNVVHVSVVDSETAEPYPIGILSDPNKAFRVGAVGVAVRGNEEFEVGPFIVCTPTCPKGSGGN